jgi:hypothetical protein
MTKNSGLADSPFFSVKAEDVPTPPVKELVAVEAETPPQDSPPASIDSEQETRPVHRATLRAAKKEVTTRQPRSRDVMTSRSQDTATPSQRGITVSCSQELIAKFRSVVKQIGKEPTTCRLTLEEKRVLKAVEFEYSTKDIQTSANEIMRIAINCVIDDLKENGEKSILDTVLRALKE